MAKGRRNNPDLYTQARDFAIDIKDLLNGTVCNGAVVKAAILPHGDGDVAIGTDPDPDLGTSRAVPLTVGNRKPRLWLEVQYRCCLNEAGTHLTIVNSMFMVHADKDGEDPLCHFDFERDKQMYPTAHLQVYGWSTALGQITAGSERPRQITELNHLHFPVGGRRYRPCLEDVIEFLIVERLAEGRSGWWHVVDKGRQEFQEIQLRAAVRRNPAAAIDVLREMGEIAD